jgi:hypothetical protein
MSSAPYPREASKTIFCCFEIIKSPVNNGNQHPFSGTLQVKHLLVVPKHEMGEEKRQHPDNI